MPRIAQLSAQGNLADARNRAQAVANETRERLNAESEKARHALEAKLNVKLADAEKTIVATKTAAMSNVHGIAAEAAAAIVQRLTGVAPSGWRLPCSQWRSVLTLKPKRPANSSCVMPSRARIARTSIRFGTCTR